MKQICTICGYTYDPDTADTAWEELSDDWCCPECGADKDLFEAA